MFEYNISKMFKLSVFTLNQFEGSGWVFVALSQNR